jgi:hypothetical protein
LSAKKKILYVQTSGVDTPERTYAPFILAATAAAMGLEASIYFVIKGITIIKKGAAEQVKIGQFPTLRQVMDQAIKAGVKLVVCEQSCMLLDIARGDFIPEASVVGAATLNDMALDADATLCF